MDLLRNTHHVMWEKKHYKAENYRDLRNHPVMKHTLLIPVHRALHAEIPPPPRPNIGLLFTMLNHLDHIPKGEQPLDSFRGLIDFLGEVAERDVPISEKAGILAVHFSSQLHFIELGQLPDDRISLSALRPDIPKVQ